ncbi:hypothetical protein IWX49DRAFT_412497 [Phyllosticta citricarpa]|uniref:Uncharacterized protein n=2 Tax=Phyllosticta TaxID=121621 RepID=A0ABR1L6D0_9PEZI
MCRGALGTLQGGGAIGESAVRRPTWMTREGLRRAGLEDLVQFSGASAGEGLCFVPGGGRELGWHRKAEGTSLSRLRLLARLVLVRPQSASGFDRHALNFHLDDHLSHHLCLIRTFVVSACFFIRQFQKYCPVFVHFPTAVASIRCFLDRESTRKLVPMLSRASSIIKDRSRDRDSTARRRTRHLHGQQEDLRPTVKTIRPRLPILFVC